MRCFLPAMALLLFVNTYGQIDQKKLDSLSRLIDSSAQAYKVHQQTVIKHQNRIYSSEVKKAMQKNARNAPDFFTEQKNKEAGKRQLTMLRILMGVVLVITVMMALLLKRKTKI